MDNHNCNILFWSGGKDAYLALLAIRNTSSETILLTTYNQENGQVPQQNISIGDIEKQARQLHLKLLKIPLPEYCPNRLYLDNIQHTLRLLPCIPILIFGDLHIAEIRSWREKEFGEMGYRCQFPIWKKPGRHLLDVLWQQPVDVYISSVSESHTHILQPGMKYDEALVESLPDYIDPMGENGEFHTHIRFRNAG